MTSAFSKVGEVIHKSDGKGGWVSDLRVLRVWSGLIWAMIWLRACKRISCLGLYAFLVCFVFSQQLFTWQITKALPPLWSFLSLLPRHILPPRLYSTARCLQACSPLHPGSKPSMAFYHVSHKFPSLALTGLHNMALTALMPYLPHSSAPTCCHRMRLPTLLSQLSTFPCLCSISFFSA